MKKNTNSIKPIVFRDLIVYRVPQNLNIGVKSLIETINSHVDYLHSFRSSGLFLSLLHINKLNQASLKELLEYFIKLHAKLSIPTGFIDYSSSMYKILIPISTHTQVVLAKNIDMASVLLGTVKPSKNEMVILYSEDELVANEIYAELMTHGFDVVLTQSMDELKERSKKVHFLQAIYGSRLNKHFQKIKTNFKTGCYIYSLVGSIDNNIAAAFHTKKHKKRILDGFRVFCINVENVSRITKEAIMFLVALAKLSKKQDAQFYIYAVSDAVFDIESIQLLTQDFSLIKCYAFNDCFKDAQNSGLIKLTHDMKDTDQVVVSKELVSNIPIIIRSFIKVLRSYGYDNKKQSSTKPFITNTDVIDEQMVGLISFDGDVRATLFVFFSLKQIGHVCESIFGEVSTDEQELQDLAKEILNIIGGKIKATLDEAHIFISISLPEAFFSKHDLQDFLNKRYGILTNIHFDGEPFKVFVVGSCLLSVL